jgi:DNA-binding NarL/FixJ family response regulator
VSRARILIIDNESALGETELSSDPELDVTRVDSFAAADRSIRELCPTCIVLCLGEPSVDESRLVRSLNQRAGSVLVITPPSDERRIATLLKAGASGYLFLTDAKLRLVSAVHELLRGGIPMTAQAARVVLNRARRSSSQMAAVRPGRLATEQVLSQRQREVLGLLARGHSYEHIALALDLSVNTVRTHLRAIYERLGASTKVEAVLVARELGLIDRVLST